MTDKIRNRVVGCLLVVIGVLWITPNVVAQRDRDRNQQRDADAEMLRYINRSDRDGDGYLSEREIGGRGRRYMQENGIDIGKGPVRLSTVQRQIQKRIDAKAQAAKAEEIDANRKVAKFGTGEVSTPPPNFEIVTQAEGRIEDQYDEEIVSEVRSYLQRYDENGDGVLNGQESRRIRRVLGEGADKNEDGKLGELELAAAVKAQQENGRNRDRDRQGERGNRDFNRGRRGGRGDRRREQNQSQSSRDGGNPRSFTGTSQPSGGNSSRTSSSSRSSSKKRSDAGKMSAYVNGLYKDYDKDSSGTLSKSERKDMSSSLSKRLVDVDGDGEISRKEAEDSLSGRAKPVPAAESSEKKDEEPRRRRPTRRRRSSDEDDDDKATDQSEKKPSSTSRTRRSRGPRSSTTESQMKYDIQGFQNIPIEIEKRQGTRERLEREGASSKFLELDKNQDGQLSIFEFRDGRKWTDSLASEFQELDANDDGMITIKEYND